MIHTTKVLIAISAIWLLSAVAVRAQTAHLQWIIKGDQSVSTSKAERVYLEACRWVEDQFGYGDRRIRPSITVHVGEPCPNPALSGPCTSVSEGQVYLPQWDKSSEGAVAQATILAGLLQLVDRQELQNIARTILTDDAKHFVDASALAMANE
jgi:hypothetical protein